MVLNRDSRPDFGSHVAVPTCAPPHTLSTSLWLYEHMVDLLLRIFIYFIAKEYYLFPR